MRVLREILFGDCGENCQKIREMLIASICIREGLRIASSTRRLLVQKTRALVYPYILCLHYDVKMHADFSDLFEYDGNCYTRENEIGIKSFQFQTHSYTEENRHDRFH